MKRYKFDKLWIQITRRCNKKCAHCLKGEAQNLSISKEIIDKLIRDVEDVFIIKTTHHMPKMTRYFLVMITQKI